MCIRDRSSCNCPQPISSTRDLRKVLNHARGASGSPCILFSILSIWPGSSPGRPPTGCHMYSAPDPG
eukprot:2247763-Pyramimonas_sp.AAC.1